MSQIHPEFCFVWSIAIPIRIGYTFPDIGVEGGIMRNLLFVGLGGFVGALLRYLLSGYIQNLSQRVDFPYGTLVVNVTGCFLIGIFSQLVNLQWDISAEVRLLIMVGLLGSFTTYSTFGNETLTLLQDQRLFLALINIGTHLFFGLLAVLLGQFAITTLWR